MPEENELSIVLKLDDKASKATVEALNKISKAAEDAGQKGKKAGEDHSKSLKDVTKDVKEFRREMLLVTLAVTAVVASTTEYAKRNRETRDTINELGIAWKNALANSGKQFGDFMSKHLQFLKDFNDSFDKSGTDMLRSGDAIKNFNDQLNEQKNLFIAGKMSAEEYFNKLSKAQYDQISVNTIASSQLQELARVTAEVRNTDLLDAENKTSEQLRLLNEYKTNHAIATQGMAAFTATAAASIRTNMSSALTDMITGAKSAREAFAELGKSMIQMVVQFIAQKLIAFALEKTLLAGTTAATVTAAGVIAAAWAPAAALASLATLGGNAAPAAAALTSTAALSAGIAATSGVQRAIGVSVNGGEQAWATSGSPMPAALTRAQGGDDIVTKPTLFLAGEAGPERATFTPLGSGGNSPGGMNIEINIFGQGLNSREQTKQLAEELGYEIERYARGARSNT